MNLKTYFAHAERGTAAALARALDVSPVMVTQWAGGMKPVPAERCPAIERFTAGAVRCEDLRPDVPWDVLRNGAAPDRPAPQPTAEPQPQPAGA